MIISDFMLGNKTLMLIADRNRQVSFALSAKAGVNSHLTVSCLLLLHFYSILLKETCKSYVKHKVFYGQYLQGLPVTLCPVVWASGRRKQRPLSWTQTHIKVSPSCFRHGQDTERPSGKKIEAIPLIIYFFSQWGRPQIKHQNKKQSWRRGSRKQPLIIDIWTPAERGSRPHRQVTYGDVLTRLLFSEDALNIHLSVVFASPLSALWQTVMIISSRLMRPFKIDLHIWIINRERQCESRGPE